MHSAHSYEELVIWQLASELRDGVFDLTKNGPAAKDFDFRKQIRTSSSSAPSNIAEGFAYFKPRQFAKHLRIAIASLNETRNHLQDGAGKKGYFDQQVAGNLIRLACRTLRGAKRLLRYLDSCKGNAPLDWGRLNGERGNSRKPPATPDSKPSEDAGENNRQ
jgi:four helix bundle protein